VDKKSKERRLEVIDAENIALKEEVSTKNLVTNTWRYLGYTIIYFYFFINI